MACRLQTTAHLLSGRSTGSCSRLTEDDLECRPVRHVLKCGNLSARGCCHLSEEVDGVLACHNCISINFNVSSSRTVSHTSWFDRGGGSKAQVAGLAAKTAKQRAEVEMRMQPM